MPKERKKVLCMDAQRHAEYYGMQQTFDELYAKSKAGEVFNGLMELVLSPDNIVCHMKVPKEQGGHERYSNLVLLHRRYLPLLTDQDTAALKSMCKQLTVTKKQLTKINSLRTAAKLVAI